MIISLYSIDCVVFITETESVYCAVRTEYLNTIQVILNLASQGQVIENSIKIFRSLPRYSGRYFVGTQNLSCSALLSGICVKSNFKISAQSQPFRRFGHSVILLPSKCTTQSKLPVCFLCCISGFLCQHHPISAPYSSLSTRYNYWKDNRANTRKLQTKQFLSLKKIFSHFGVLNKNFFFSYME